MSGDVGRSSTRLIARHIGGDAAQHHARDAAGGGGGDVALYAIQGGAFEARVVGPMFIEHVKDRTLHRVEGYELEQGRVVNLAHVHVVVEVEGTRVAGRDLRILEAGLGEHQGLRIRRD